MEPTIFFTNHLVKSEDLNHHGTLFAGRSAEWFVESGFIAVAKVLDPESIVCLKIHGLTFTRPVNCGGIVTYQSKIIYAGNTSLVVYVEMMENENPVMKGFITFIHVDKNNIPVPHGIRITPVTEEDRVIQKEAMELRKPSN